MRYDALQQWLEEEFLPWQAAAQQDHAALRAVQQQLLRHPAEVKQIIGLIFDGQAQAAAQAWNTLGLPLELRAIYLSADEEKITLEYLDDSREEILTDQLIGGLERVLSQPL